jgi:hypothetical protein
MHLALDIHRWLIFHPGLLLGDGIFILLKVVVKGIRLITPRQQYPPGMASPAGPKKGGNVVLLHTVYVAFTPCQDERKRKSTVNIGHLRNGVHLRVSTRLPAPC